MIKTTLQHYIFDFALSHIFNKYADEFVISKYITSYDLNKSHLYKYIDVFDDGIKVYKEGSEWLYGHIIVNMQIVPESQVSHFMRENTQASYWVVFRMKTDFNYSPAIVLPFVEECTAMLK